MPSRALTLLIAPVLLLAACAEQGDIPSLAPRPMEYRLSGRPLPPCLAGEADGTEAAMPTAPVSDAGLGTRVEALLAEARRGQSEFAEILPAARTSAGRAGTSGSESWVAAQQQISRLSAARARTVDALADLEALILARSREATAAEDLERLNAAADEVRAISEAQEAEIDRLNSGLSDSAALRGGPSQAPHNGRRPPAGRQALAASDRGHISPAAPPRADPTGSACRG